MATPIGAILCVEMLELSAAVLGVACVLTAIFRVELEEAIVPAHRGSQPRRSRSDERLAATAV